MATERELTADMSHEELVSAMEANTQLEIFEDALADKQEDEIADETDTSPEEMEAILDEDVPQDEEEGENEDDDPDAQSEQDDGTQQEPERDEQPGPVPSARLRDETRRREAIEQERDTLRAQLAAFQAVQQMQQRPAPQQEQPAQPDIWSDPEAWAANQRDQIAREFTAKHVNAALAEAHEEHGDEFVAAYRALTSQNPQDPVARATVQRVWDAPNPGKALMRWHGEQQILRQAGGDPRAYKQQVAKEIMSDPEFRRQLLAEMRGEAQRGDGGRPRTSTRLPKSLNGASGGGSVRTGDPELYNNAEDSVFAFAMK